MTTEDPDFDLHLDKEIVQTAAEIAVEDFVKEVLGEEKESQEFEARLEEFYRNVSDTEIDCLLREAGRCGVDTPYFCKFFLKNRYANHVPNQSACLNADYACPVSQKILYICVCVYVNQKNYFF